MIKEIGKGSTIQHMKRYREGSKDLQQKSKPHPLDQLNGLSLYPYLSSPSTSAN
jgi:hypothetical protein